MSAALARLDGALAALPPPYDEQRLTTATQALASARAALTAAEQSHLAAVRDAQSLDALSKQTQALAARRSQVDARRRHVENELGNWNLFARCMSNDGLIALVIDDAGPALSALANDLLLACCGPRFTVSIHTLLETGKGEQKEGFHIVVHDDETGESKSVAWMSGGGKEHRRVLPDPRDRAVSGAELWAAIHDAVLRRGRRCARPGAQAHVHGDEARGTAPGWLRA